MAGVWRALEAARAAILTLLFLPISHVKAGGTTSNLQQIFVGRCWDYQRVVNPQSFSESGTKNCTYLYESFISAFKNRGHCEVSIEDYNNYTEAASHPIESNKHMFWIGVYTLVHSYSDLGRRFHTISDTLTGYIVNSLMWCGSTSNGFDMSDCPAYNECPQEASVSFWKKASIKYASLASGTAYLMLNGSRSSAFYTQSVFASYELVNVDPNKVSLLHTYVIHDIGKPHLESCGTGSLILLERLVRERGLNYKCTDDPIAVRHLQCVDKVDEPECMNLTSSALSEHRQRVVIETVSLLLILTLILH